MVASVFGENAVCEVAVILFQVFGVASLCLSRLLPTTRWVERGRTVFVIALIGLGVTGALCGSHDSEFALFAGLSMTVLLIGMNMGSGATDMERLATVRTQHLAGRLGS
jgi:hypothetical protein